MKNIIALGLAAAPVLAFAGSGLYGDAPDAKHAWAVHDWNRPKPAKVEVDEKGIPSDAVVLFDGTKELFEKNWRDSKGKPSKWSYSEDGYFYSVPNWKNGGCIYSREEFGDCQLHIEYRHDPNQIVTNKGPQKRGNSGVFLMDKYEVQVLESYYTSKDLDGKEGFVDNYADGQAGAVYAENPPAVNPARKPGEWQVYDIVFHQPVWNGKTLVHPGSVTVFFNGVLVQDHWEMEGLTTHCKRRPLAPHATKGPLHLQDHGCVVQYRNIWYRPLPSRWDNKTHSNMSADPEAVMALRRETAAKLFAKIKDPKAATAANVQALGEVISYANEGEYKEAFDAALEAYRAKPGNKNEVHILNKALDVLVRAKVIPASAKLAE